MRQSSSNVDPGRRRALRAALVSAAAIAGAPALALGGSIDPGDGRDFEVVRARIRIPNLPERLRGLRIAMISDIHSGPYMDKATMDRYVAAINRMRPELILIPGDFVQSRVDEADPLCESLQHLRAEYGVYGCLGNHDFYADGDTVATDLERAGVRMLRNENVSPDPRGERFNLIGIDDVRQRHPFDMLFALASAELRRDTPSLLLCHKPYYFDEAATWGVDLMVSGHTHGGQIVLGRVPGAVVTPAALVSGYVEGAYRRDASQLYVTRGIGVVGLPIRVNCPPEITALTLV
jgi:uncharacterized protein